MVRSSILPAIIIFLLIILTLSSTSQAQLIEIKNSFPKIVPVEVEFKNHDKESWWHDLEIRVTNIGKKPIYYLSFTLWLDATYPENVGPGSGKELVIVFEFGDIKRFYSTNNGEIASPHDTAILPGRSHTFTVPNNYVKLWDHLKKIGTFVEPRNGTLTHGFTNFGNGTGFEPGGTPWRTPKKKEFSTY